MVRIHVELVIQPEAHDRRSITFFRQCILPFALQIRMPMLIALTTARLPGPPPTVKYQGIEIVRRRYSATICGFADLLCNVGIASQAGYGHQSWLHGVRSSGFSSGIGCLMRDILACSIMPGSLSDVEGGKDGVQIVRRMPRCKVILSVCAHTYHYSCSALFLF